MDDKFDVGNHVHRHNDQGETHTTQTSGGTIRKKTKKHHTSICNMEEEDIIKHIVYLLSSPLFFRWQPSASRSVGNNTKTAPEDTTSQEIRDGPSHARGIYDGDGNDFFFFFCCCSCSSRATVVFFLSCHVAHLSVTIHCPNRHRHTQAQK